jgi:8-oxo-dGTP pyrophosphatase MutT (NUDIX family)
MKKIDTLIHPNLSSLNGRAYERLAVRAIVLHGKEILLLYTRRYDDFSFPGGGVNVTEDPVLGLQRELREETGARNACVLEHYGYIDEYRPHPKPGYDLTYMRSHFYVCQVDRELGDTAMESYELANGMVPHWTNIHQAIAHNEHVLAANPASIGLSIHRETYMLKHVAHAFL